MSSSDRLNPQQLQMFIPAGELRAMPSNQVASGHSWEQILLESRDRRPHTHSAWGDPDKVGFGKTLYESIRDKGVNKPVEVAHGENLNWYTGGKGVRGERWPAPRLHHGHHRVAVSSDIDPKREIPVEHHEW